MINRLKQLIFPVLIFVISSCEINNKNTPKHTVNRESYYRGKIVYINNCQGCHKENGEGFNNLYPPLANSDFLKKKPKKAIRYIYYGTNDTISVNGKTYNFKMPDNKHLTREEIADVMNYISNSWGNNTKEYDLKQINEILK